MILTLFVKYILFFMTLKSICSFLSAHWKLASSISFLFPRKNHHFWQYAIAYSAHLRPLKTLEPTWISEKLHFLSYSPGYNSPWECGKCRQLSIAKLWIHGFTVSVPVFILPIFQQLLLRNRKISSKCLFWNEQT